MFSLCRSMAPTRGLPGGVGHNHPDTIAAVNSVMALSP